MTTENLSLHNMDEAKCQHFTDKNKYPSTFVFVKKCISIITLFFFVQNAYFSSVSTLLKVKNSEQSMQDIRLNENPIQQMPQCRQKLL